MSVSFFTRLTNLLTINQRIYQEEIIMQSIDLISGE